jgi:hypothetical protein
MLQTVRPRFVAIVFAITLAAAAAWGEKPANIPPADAAVPANVSARLFAARSVFISGTWQAPVSRMGPAQDLEYADFQVTSTIASWGLYSLVHSAYGADLVFELVAKEPIFRIVVRDAKTNAVIWTFARRGESGFMGLNAPNSFNRSIFDVLDDVRRAASPPFTTQDASSARSASISAVPKVFISNLGGDEARKRYTWRNSPYNLLYAALQNSGRFELVMAPAQAELIFEIQYADPERSLYVGKSDDEPLSSGYTSLNAPQVKLLVWHGATHAVLLASTEYLSYSGFVVNLSRIEKEQANAIEALVSKAEKALGKAEATAALPAKIKDAPLPAQIAAARKVFVAPARGSESYDQLCTAIKRGGRYELVTTAADADLMIELSFPGPMDHFVLLDPKTQVILWEVNVTLYHRNPVPDFEPRMGRAERIAYELAFPPRKPPAIPANATELNVASLVKVFDDLDAPAAGVEPVAAKTQGAKQGPKKPADTPARPD